MLGTSPVRRPTESERRLPFRVLAERGLVGGGGARRRRSRGAQPAEPPRDEPRRV